MDIIVDRSIKFNIPKSILENIRLISKSLIEEFKNFESYSETVKKIILENEIKTRNEGWLYYYFKDEKIINFESPCLDQKAFEDEIRKTINSDTPSDFLKEHSILYTFLVHNSMDDYVHPKIREKYSVLIKKIESLPDLIESIYFQIGPNFFLAPHTDGDNYKNYYTFLINLSFPKAGSFIKINERVIRLKGTDVFLFDATNGIHSAWNLSSDENWELLVIRIKEPFLIPSV